MKKLLVGVLALVFIVFFGIVGRSLYQKYQTSQKAKNLRLYWFIPDGVRADPFVFTVFDWAREGKLPNIKKMMDMGTYGYSKPVFPGHTPTNFATLMTGTYPEVHGVNDGPMRVVGYPLDKVAIPGFRSVAKKVPPIWKTLEENGLNVALISVPGSTPPEIEKGTVLRGRWGGWGADFQALIFETKGDLSRKISQGRASRLFFFGPQLTQYVDATNPEGWENVPVSYSPPKEVTMTGWGTPIYIYLYDETDDNAVSYNKALFSLDKKTKIADLSQGQWSSWSPLTLKWTVDDKTIDVPSDVRLNLIKLDNGGFFRVLAFYNNLNTYISTPSDIANILKKSIGPMADFTDNFPAQLGYYPEDKKAFMDELDMTFDWHTRVISALTKAAAPNVVIHDIYNPTVMLCGKWWTGFIDPTSNRYKEISDNEREKLWNEVKDMYKRLDDMVGEILSQRGPNTYVVFSSDHGVMPLTTNINLNNLFAQKGWLKFTIDPKTGEPIIDWKSSKVIYLKMAHVWINPKGLDGNFVRQTGIEYEALRQAVKQAIEDIRDTNGVKPLVKAVEWEHVKEVFRLDPERAGDLVLENAANYRWNEEMSNDLALFSKSFDTGYKQAVDVNDSRMWTPFIIIGPDIKKNNYLGDSPIDHVDQYPTIMKALGIASPAFVQGKITPVFTNDGRH